ARQRIRQQVGRRRSVVGLGASLRRAAAGLVGLTTLAGACWLAGSGLAGACWLAGRTGPGGIGRVGGALSVAAPGGGLGSPVPGWPAPAGWPVAPDREGSAGSAGP